MILFSPKTVNVIVILQGNALEGLGELSASLIAQSRNDFAAKPH